MRQNFIQGTCFKMATVTSSLPAAVSSENQAKERFVFLYDRRQGNNPEVRLSTESIQDFASFKTAVKQARIFNMIFGTFWF